MMSQFALVGAVGMVLAIVVLCERRSMASLGFGSVGPWSGVQGLALAALLMYVFAPAACRVLRRLRLGGFEAGLAKLHSLPVWYLVVAVLVGGTAEEILYRG
jgi:membrane protease YdiL (CAAX protease family)